MRVFLLAIVAAFVVAATGADAWTGNECHDARVEYMESVKDLAVLSKKVGEDMKAWKAEYDHVQDAHDRVKEDCAVVIIA